MINEFFFWFIRPMAEALGVLAMVFVAAICIFTFYWTCDKYRTYKIRKSLKKK